MNLVYEKMQKEGKIGPFMMGANGTLVSRPFQEYPKVVHRKDAAGKLVSKICKDQREELAFKQEHLEPGEAPDPVVAEKNALARQVADLQAQLAKMQAAQKDTDLQKAPATEPSSPAKPIPAAALASGGIDALKVTK